MSETNTSTPPDTGAGWEARAINTAFDSAGITFNSSRADTLKAFGRDITFDESGKPYALYDGEISELSHALQCYAFDHRDICDGRTLPRSGAGKARPGVESKADFKSAAEKAKYIEDRGIEAWERLPLTNAASKETLTKSDWYKLPTSEKIRRLDADPDAFTKLPNTPAELTGGMVNGSRINHSALDKQRAIRPTR